jgi:hypothetical protein
MKVVCQNCGEVVIVSGLGRKAFNVPVTIICDKLRVCKDVGKAAELLDCSPAYLYKVLKAEGLKTKDIIKK